MACEGSLNLPHLTTNLLIEYGLRACNRTIDLMELDADGFAQVREEKSV